MQVANDTETESFIARAAAARECHAAAFDRLAAAAPLPPKPVAHFAPPPRDLVVTASRGAVAAPHTMSLGSDAAASPADLRPKAGIPSGSAPPRAAPPTRRAPCPARPGGGR